jgi:hypothetical protein
MGDQHPCDGAFDGCFEILGEAPALPNLGEGSFHHPAARPQNKALRGIAALDDFNRPSAFALKGLAQLVSGIATVGEDNRARRLSKDFEATIESALAVLIMRQLARAKNTPA